jgi:hypothetical protein
MLHTQVASSMAAKALNITERFIALSSSMLLDSSYTTVSSEHPCHPFEPRWQASQPLAAGDGSHRRQAGLGARWANALALAVSGWGPQQTLGMTTPALLPTI